MAYACEKDFARDAVFSVAASSSRAYKVRQL